MRFFLSAILLTTFGFAFSCRVGESEQGKAAKLLSTSSESSPTNESGCDETLWQHVYDPTRLEIEDRCKNVTGVIEELDHNEDGDTHMLLQLDSGQEDLLKKKNKTKKDGNLVIEVVCSAPVKAKKVGDTCSGYESHIKIPNVGDHVIVTGSYVIDSHNGWGEIHPVSRIAFALNLRLTKSNRPIPYIRHINGKMERKAICSGDRREVWVLAFV